MNAFSLFFLLFFYSKTTMCQFSVNMETAKDKLYAFLYLLSSRRQIITSIAIKTIPKNMMKKYGWLNELHSYKFRRSWITKHKILLNLLKFDFYIRKQQFCVCVMSVRIQLHLLQFDVYDIILHNLTWKMMFLFRLKYLSVLESNRPCLGWNVRTWIWNLYEQKTFISPKNYIFTNVVFFQYIHIWIRTVQ